MNTHCSTHGIRFFVLPERPDGHIYRCVICEIERADKAEAALKALRPEVTRIEPEAGEIAHKLAQAENLLSRIAQANVIFPSMCSNNMEAWNLTEELKAYHCGPQPQPDPEPEAPIDPDYFDGAGDR